MIRWILGFLAVLFVGIGIAFWWLMLSDSKVPDTANVGFDIGVWRDLASAPTDQKPTKLEILEVGRDQAPAFAATAGRFGRNADMSYNAVRIVTPDETIIVGGAVDLETAESMKTTEAAWGFDAPAYRTLTFAMQNADKVLMTHEHLDHIMAIARHPNAAALAPHLWLNAHQIDALPLFAKGELDPALQTLEPRLDGSAKAIAPGVVVVPAAGHTPGSQLVFVSMADGTEVVLIGDIVWNMASLEQLTTRPVLTQYLVFSPNYEDRDAVKNQIRALHDISEANPNLVVLPSHDREFLQAIAASTSIDWGWSEN